MQQGRKTLAGRTEGPHDGTVDQLHALDAEFLLLEDGVDHMHIGACAVLEGPCPTPAETEAWVRAALPSIPRYRQRLRNVPFGIGRPGWEDAEDFDLSNHLLTISLPSPGGADELEALVGQVMSTELDRAHPLWELWVVEGLDGDQWAVIAKVHHCLVDGLAGMALLQALLDTEPDPPEVVGDDWRPGPGPSDTRLLVDAVGDLVHPLLAAPGWAWHQLTHPVDTVRRLGALTSGLVTFAGTVPPTGRSSLDGPVGPGRRWTTATTTLDRAKAIRAERGGTVNDVVLAAVTRGLRDLLLARGEDPGTVELRAAIPVSVRTDHEALDNQVSAIVITLPVGVSTPELRFQVLRAETQRLKASHEAEAGQLATGLADLVPAPLVAAGTAVAHRLLRRHPQRNVSTVITNVPGPQFPLYAAGRRMLRYLPFVPVALGVRIAVAIVSYDGGLAFGITGDEASTPDLEVVARGIEAAIDELDAPTGGGASLHGA